MGMCRVYVNQDGSVRIMLPNMKYWNAEVCSEEEFCRQACDADMGKDPSLDDIPYYDVDDSTIPKDRSKRHAWRWSGNLGLHVDENIPDPPDPRTEKIEKIEKATTIQGLKDILKEIV